MDYELKTGVVIVAGGSGSRCGGSIPKQFRLLAGQPVLAHTINAFGKALPGARIVVVLPSEWRDFWHNLAARFDVAAHDVAEGGKERFDSVKNGLAALGGGLQLIAVHDGARPLVSAEVIRRTAAAAAEHGAAIPVVEVVDSYREITASGSVAVDRQKLRIVQTPQIFRAELLHAAYRQPSDPRFTDDASVVEAAGGDVALVNGCHTNLKITTAGDFAIAEAILEAQKREDETDF